MGVASSPAVAERLDRLAPDQRAAATMPPGPVLCIAPAGSGKTTTLVARVAWLVDRGVAPGSIAAITFNKRAADELTARLDDALRPIAVDSDAVRVRTFHALGREIIAAAGQPVEPLVDRVAVLAELHPDASAAQLRRLDTAISRLKLDLRVDPAAIDADADAGPIARAYASYERALGRRGGLDFDDLVARALRLLEADSTARQRWRRACSNLLVDEAQDLDRSQLDLALLLAAPDNRIFLVGDDDQSIYGWRLADVRRVLGLAAALPGLRQVHLITNYRCPPPVVERAVRLVEHNRERFAKRIVAGPASAGRLILAPDGREDTIRIGRLLDSWPADGQSRAILARTNRELLPAAAACLPRGVAFRAPGLELLVEDARVDDLLDRVEPDRPEAPALLVRIGALRQHPAVGSADEGGEVRGLVTALLAWAAPFDDLATLRSAVAHVRELLARLRRDDAALVLATVHGTKGLEWDHVALIGLDAGRFPSARSVGEAAEPGRAMEEERRLAYVGMTRARRSLTLAYDPALPSPFLLEAFDVDELGATSAGAATIRE